MKLPVLVIAGPTASGKSELAQNVALALNGEVISADSMQVYRGMDIGTAKLSPRQRRVPHHLIDILDPGQPYSAQLFQKQARSIFSQLETRGKTSILCGGTGLYIQAALEDMRFPAGEQTHNPVREKYEEIAKRDGGQALWELLRTRDKASAEVIHPHNTRRVIRALEMAEEGVSYAQQIEHMKNLPEIFPSVRYALNVDSQILAKRINRRVDYMFECGLVREVQELIQHGFREALTAPQAIGYKEIVAALDGTITLEQAKEDIKGATRRYAKRQRSWLRRDSRLKWLDADSLGQDKLTQIIVDDYAQYASMK